MDYEIYIAFGVIDGYSININSKSKIDLPSVDVSKFEKVYVHNNEFDQIASLIKEQEKEYINPAEVYSVSLSGKIYYCVKELGYGDFLAIDKRKTVYKFTHDPFEVQVTHISLIDAIMGLPTDLNDA
jgi:hypothetical protein